MSTSHHTGRPSARRSSLPRYDLRRRVLVSNLSRNIHPPSSQSTKLAPSTALPSKLNSSAPLDLIKDLPNGESIGKRVKMHCVSSHPAAMVTPEKKQDTKFRIDPAILRNPMVHTPVKASPPKRRRSDGNGPPRDTMSIHLLREDYVPPAKRDRLDASIKDVTIFTNTSAGALCPLKDEPSDKQTAPTKPVPLPRKSKMTSTSSSNESRSESAASSHTSTDSDPIYALIANCTTGSKEDLVKYGHNGILPLVSPGFRSIVGHAIEPQAASFLKDCTDGKRRISSPFEESRARLRPRFSSTSSGECRARKSLLFSDGVDTSKAPSGLTLKNIYAVENLSESPLRNTLSRIPSPPDDRCLRSQPRILNQSGIYSNNTLVVESKKLKKDEVDRSYGFTCRMRPMLRALSERKAAQLLLLPSKRAKREMEIETPLKGANIDIAPPLPPPRPAKATATTTAASPKLIHSNQIKNSQTENAPTTPNREVAIQTSFLVHGLDNCPQSLKDSSAKKRRRSMEIIAEVGAKVKRKGSILRDKIRRSLELTPGKTTSQELPT